MVLSYKTILKHAWLTVKHKFHETTIIYQQIFKLIKIKFHILLLLKIINLRIRTINIEFN